MFTGIILQARSMPSNKSSENKSLDYALHSCFRKIFSTRDQAVVVCMVFLYYSSSV